MTAAGDCFGFYTGEWKCKEGGCRLSAQCKAFVNSDGLDIAADAIGDLMELLPDQPYVDTSSIRVLLEQLVNPAKVQVVISKLSLENTVLKGLGLFPDVADPL